MVTKKTTARYAAEQLQDDENKTRHQPVSTNSLKIKPDHLKTFEPLTENQRLFFEMYKGGAYFMGLFGSPGVGKTFLALYKALEEVLDKSNSFKQVVVVRSLVQLRDVGFLPGDLNEKQEIYELPYKEISATLFGRNDAWDRLKEQGHVRFISTTAIRGISIDDAIILVDENQNLNLESYDSGSSGSVAPVISSNSSSVDLPDKPIPATATVRDTTPIFAHVMQGYLSPV